MSDARPQDAPTRTDDVVAVILAGGLGTRIRHLLPDIPKPMAPVADRPCLEWLVRYLVKQQISRVVISTGYRTEVIEKHFATNPVAGAQVCCTAEPEPLGTAGGLLHAIKNCGQTARAWLVLNGDTFVFAELAQALDALREPSTSGVICTQQVADASRYGTVVSDAKGNLAKFEEKRPGPGAINTGLYLFRDKLVKSFPDRTPLSLERDVFPALTAKGVSLKVLPVLAPFLDIGTPESLPEADAFVRSHLSAFALPKV